MCENMLLKALLKDSSRLNQGPIKPYHAEPRYILKKMGIQISQKPANQDPYCFTALLITLNGLDKDWGRVSFIKNQA